MLGRTSAYAPGTSPSPIGYPKPSIVTPAKFGGVMALANQRNHDEIVLECPFGPEFSSGERRAAMVQRARGKPGALEALELGAPHRHASALQLLDEPDRRWTR